MHMLLILMCSANRSFRCFLSGSVLIRFPISWMVFYGKKNPRSSLTLLSSCASMNAFAAFWIHAAIYSAIPSLPDVFRMCSYLYASQIRSCEFSKTVRRSASLERD